MIYFLTVSDDHTVFILQKAPLPATVVLMASAGSSCKFRSSVLPFRAILDCFWHFWVVLGEPVTYMITRGIELVVGRVTALRGFRRVWRGFGWSGGV